MSLRFVPVAGAEAEGDLAGAVRAQRTRGAPPAIAEALLAADAAVLSRERLLAGGALAVTAGQQPGLFTGPLYTLYKALHAASLAAELAALLDAPVVPVFWVAGDDHDFAEINHATVLDGQGHAARVLLRERAADAPMLPAYREPVGADGARALAELAALLPPSDARDETVAWLANAYRAERSMAEACSVALAELLGPMGVVVVRGWHPALKRAASNVLLGAARQAAALDASLAAEAARLSASGRQPPVAVGQGLSLLMLEGPAGRDRLRLAGDGRFESRRGHAPVSLASLERILADEPERLSANVLLRPAVEAALFPTVAYLGGPGEMAYLAQAGPVFAALQVPRPLRVPRVSGWLVEPKVDKVLTKFGLSPADLGGGEGALTARLAREALPPAAQQALAGLREALASGYGALRDEAVRLDPTLQRTVEGTRNQALLGAAKLEKKLLAALRRSGDTALAQVARAGAHLYPTGRMQERVLTAASMLGRHGRSALALVREAADEASRTVLSRHGTGS